MNFGERMNRLKRKRERDATKRKTKRKTVAARTARKSTTTTSKAIAKRSTTMAKGKSSGKRKSSGKGKRKGGRRKASGGGPFGLTSTQTTIALGTAALYGTLQAKAMEASKKNSEDLQWFRKSPTVKPIGRSLTYAGVAYGLYRMNVQPKYTKPIAIGLGIVGFLQLAQRGFKLYDAEPSIVMSGADDGALEAGEQHEQVHLAGGIDPSEAAAWAEVEHDQADYYEASEAA